MPFDRLWRRALRTGGVLLAAVGWCVGLATSAAAGGEPGKGEPARGEPVEHGPVVSTAANAPEEKAIRAAQAAYVKAFNAGDARALAAFWAADGEFIDARGNLLRGRSAIEKEFAAFFAESKGLRLEIATDALRFVGPGVALESGRSRVLHGADGGAATAYSIVHTKRDGQWQLASVREAAYLPGSNYEHLRDLEWLVGTWLAREGGQTLELTCEWADKRNFLIRKYALKTAEGTTRSGVQIIGWDPLRGGIRSWVFDGDGGFGSELWTRDGPRWVLAATGVTREAVSTTATNLLRRLDQDHFQWQSVQRAIGPNRLPDTAAIKITRVKTTK